MKKTLLRFARQWQLYGAGAMAVLAALFTFIGQPELSRWVIITYSAIVVVVLGWGMIKTLRNGQFGVDILAIMAIISTLAVDQHWATLVIIFMLVSGEALETFAQARAKRELTDLLKRAPTIAHRVVDGVEEEISVDDIAVGDELIVRPAEVTPVDGVVISGEGFVDESAITGESQPVEVTRDTEVLSGVVNGESVLTIKALRTVEKSQYAQIVSLVQAAADSRAPFVRLADRYAVPFTIISLIIASVAWWLSGDPVRFAEVLVVATPCPLLIAAPVALISGMSRSAKHGIIVKSGATLERLARVKTAVFDKTGTLTYGLLSVNSVLPVTGVSEDEVVRLAAIAEKHSTHILANALQEYAKSHSITVDEPSDVDETPGKGVRATTGDTGIIAGRINYLRDCGVTGDIPEVEGTAVYIARGTEYIGAITFADTIRDDSIDTLARLRKLGVEKIAMLTGDHAATARRVADALSIDDLHAECLPADKLTAVKSFTNGPVMMVGDGVNDAPVLAAADVGVAMGARGATAASESADVVIMLDDIARVAKGVSIAQRTIHIALQSVLIGIVISIILMLIAATGRIPAIVGAGLQELVDGVVILNALRAHGSGRK